MLLSPGTRLHSYEITSLLGQGGMGEVYRATDTKLGREVALKILPEVFAADADRLARFEREAKTLALLNHPNVAHVYDAGTSDHGAYLVMELVTGEDLSAHIARGALPLSDTLAVARQLVEALEAAHESGIVHRDLKPANIKVRPDGVVKVLDFGLAKALDPNSAGATSEAMNSPTLTARATQMGMIIGTAAYMAPEQARGRAVDRRADIWAFGVVLYEMLAGRRAFDGEDVSITLAGVLKEDVVWSALPADVPVALHRLLKRCLEKDPKRRLGWIGEARLALENPTADDLRQVAPAAAPALPPVAGWRRALPWTMAVLGLGTAIASLAAWAPWRASSVPEPIRLLTDIGAQASLTLGRGPAAILSPDGSLLAFVAQQGVQTRLFVRKLDQLQATPLAGTEGAESPFFSPGGDWIGFFADAQLKKVPVTGGAPRKICDVPNGRGAAWAEDGTIIYTPSSGTAVSLMRVSAEGGKPTEFGALGKDAITQRWPQVLPGGRYVLYTENSTTADFNSSNIVAAPLAGGPPTILVRGAYGARYVPSPADATHQRGHLIYMQQGTVFAAPVDLNRLDAVGPGVVAVEGVSALPTFGSMQVSLSSNGTLVYAPGSAAAQNLSLEWLARDGKTAKLHADKSQWSEARFSPEGRKLAMVVYDGRQRDIWIDDVAQDKLTQFTFDPGRDRTPVWSPDGKRILFSSDRANAGVTNLYWMNADGTGSVTRLTDSPNAQIAFSWYGKFILFQETRQGTGLDLMVLPLEGSEAQGWKPGTPTVFLATPGVEVYPQFSPDGRWVSYFAPENGIPDVWVRPFPATNGGQQRVSVGGGSFAKWSGSSPELVFSVSSRDLKVVPYRAVGSSFEVGKVAAWSPTQITTHGNEDPFALHPDGKRIAAAVSTGDTGVINDKVVLVFNFAEYLDAIAPVKK